MSIDGTLLTLDLAGRTGYAYGDPDFDDGPTFAHYQFPSTGDNYGRHQANVRSWSTQIITRINPVLIGYEQPSLFAKTTPATIVKLCCYGSTVEEVCLPENLGVKVRQINPSQVKKFWTGKGNAKKPDMVERAIKLGFRVDVDDEADAIACWYWMVHCYGSEQQKRRFEQARFEVDMGRKQKAVL